MKKLWYNCHIATMQQGRYSIIKNAALLTEAGVIEWVGQEQHVLLKEQVEKIDLHGAWLTPGLIDCHTHSVFAGDRSSEFEQRLNGMSYEKIAALGGGIASSVRATRRATEDELYTQSLARIEQLRREGVTTLEIKSGYGLDQDNEAKMLRVIRKLGQNLPMHICSTYLAAHALPIEYKDRADEYIDLVCTQMLPEFHQAGLFDAVDAFCEHLAFSPAQVERIFKVAQQLNVPVKLHAEQLSSLGGSSLAAQYHALSADHLEYMTEADVVAMANANSVAVLLPGAFFTLREKQLPPVQSLIKHNVPIALSTDLNPGTSPVLSLRLMMNLGCTLFALTPEQALAAVTIHAAQALGLLHSHGSLERGKVADFVAWEITHPAELSYWLGGDLNKRVIYRGEEIHF